MMSRYCYASDALDRPYSSCLNESLPGLGCHRYCCDGAAVWRLGVAAFWVHCSLPAGPARRRPTKLFSSVARHRVYLASASSRSASTLLESLEACGAACLDRQDQHKEELH